jgi:peptidoglycan/xylan/chitin deacetylase (PgdA/CDA1 family)
MPQRASDENAPVRRDRIYGRHRALAVKPRSYYLAKHWWQRGRIALTKRGTKPYDWSSIRILAYHRVADDDDELSVPPARFSAHMEVLANADVKVVDVDEALRLLAEDMTERFVCVTFDDGYLDNLTNAVPVLERLELPARIYLATAVTDGDAGFAWYAQQPPLLSWDQIRDLARTELFSFGAQTRTHPVLPRLPDEESWEEIAGSKRDLEERLGEKISTFCYPGGLFGEREVEYVRKAGYAAGLTCEPGVNRGSQPSETLLRTMIDRRDSASDFRAKIAGYYDRPSALRTWVRSRRLLA